MIAMNQQQPTWALVTSRPQTVDSNINGKELACNLKLHDQAQTPIRVYWVPGGLCDRIQPNDWILVEQSRNGKWKISKTQTPEVMAELEEREPTQPPIKPATLPQLKAVGAPPTTTTATPERTLAEDCQEMVEIWATLRDAIADGSDQCIQAMACTIWIARSKR